MRAAFKRLAPFLFAGVLPVAVLVVGGYIYIHQREIGIDYRGELYPEGQLLLHGMNPFTSPHMNPLSDPNRIFPVPVALLLSPLTFLGPYAAAKLLAVILLGSFALALWLLGVTDWRVYGVVAMWPSTIAAVSTGNVSILVALAIAIAVRFQAHRLLPGLAIGGAVAIKLFPWPLIVWLLATRRWAAAIVACALSVATVLVALPFISLWNYARLMRNLGNAFGPDSYNVFGLLSKAGVTNPTIAQGSGYAVGLVVLVFAWRRRSLPLAVAASLALSPIVWTHFLVVLAIPLAARWPRFSPQWLIPLALVFCPGGGSGNVWETLLGIAVIVAVTAISEWPNALRHLAVRRSSLAPSHPF